MSAPDVKKIATSKTLWFFGALVVAFGFKLITGEDVGTGVNDQSATIGEGVAVAGILLRFVTSKPLVV